MTHELTEGTRILSADQVILPTGDFDRVQFVTARFEKGRTPKRWKSFSEDEGNWAALPLEEAIF